MALSSARRDRIHLMLFTLQILYASAFTHLNKKLLGRKQPRMASRSL